VGESELKGDAEEDVVGEDAQHVLWLEEGWTGD